MSKPSEPRITRIKLHEDKATGLSSSLKGANLDVVGFNISFIAQYDPQLAIKIMKLYQEAISVRKTDTRPPDEDFVLFQEQLASLMNEFRNTDISRE